MYRYVYVYIYKYMYMHTYAHIYNMCNIYIYIYIVYTNVYCNHNIVSPPLAPSVKLFFVCLYIYIYI